ncbi:MAG: hypothetical protein WC505_06650 [Patescibacteria group bacterium]
MVPPVHDCNQCKYDGAQQQAVEDGAGNRQFDAQDRRVLIVLWLSIVN